MYSFFKRLKAILIPIILVLFFLLVLIWLKNHNRPLDQDGLPKNGPTSFDELTLNSPEIKAEKNVVTLTQAFTQGETSECEQLLSSDERQNCLDQLTYALTLKQANLLGCQSIQDKQLRNTCQDKINYKLALGGDPKVCQSISDTKLKSQCLDETRLFSATEKNCQNIQSEVLKTACNEELKLQAAVQKLDPELCQELSEPSAQSRCKLTVEENQRILTQTTSAYQERKVASSVEAALSHCESLPQEKITPCKEAVKNQS